MANSADPDQFIVSANNVDPDKLAFIVSANNVDPDKLASEEDNWISWLLMKSTDLDLHCLQMHGISAGPGLNIIMCTKDVLLTYISDPILQCIPGNIDKTTPRVCFPFHGFYFLFNMYFQVPSL